MPQISAVHFFKPPSNKSAAETAAMGFESIIWTKNDETFVDDLLNEGYTGQMYQYIKLHNVHDPDHDAEQPISTAAGGSSPLNNQYAWDVGDIKKMRDDELGYADSNSWILRNVAGTSVLYGYGGNNIWLDIANTDCQDWIFSRMNGYLDAVNPDMGNRKPKDVLTGIWLDNGNSDDGGLTNGANLYPDSGGGEAWQAAMIEFYQAFYENVCKPRGLTLHINLQGGNLSQWKRHADTRQSGDPGKLVFDGIMVEYFAINVNSDHYSEADWLQTVEKSQWINGNGQLAWLVAQGRADLVETGSMSWNAHFRFCLASYLLVWDNRTRFRYTSDDYGEAFTAAEYDFLPYLGHPTSGVLESSGTYTRQFEYGSVSVTPSENTENSEVTASTSWQITYDTEHRINSGGASLSAVDGGSNWLEDSSGSPHADFDDPAGAETDTLTPSAYVDGLPSLLPLTLFDSIHRDTSTPPNASYDLTLPAAGTYPVVLGLIEDDAGITGTGERIFDVLANGNILFDDVDHIAGAGGALVGYHRVAEATITGTGLTFSFTKSTSNDVNWAGLAVLAAREQTAPVVSQVNEQINQVGDPVYISVVATDPTDSGQLTYSAVGLPSGVLMDSETGIISGVITRGNFSSLYHDVTVTVTNGDQVMFRWWIKPGDRVIGVNCGGSADTLDMLDWTADSSGSPFATNGGSPNSTPNTITYLTQVPPWQRHQDLYRTNRFDAVDPQMIYTIDCGDGEDKLLLIGFAEISGGQTIGGRVFDVMINGSTAITTLDVMDEADDSLDTAIIYPFVVTPDGSNQITVSFAKQPNTPIINLIEVYAIDAPILVTPDDQENRVGDSVNLQIGTVSGYVGGPLSFEALGLPDGLAISSSGLISGMPTVPGVYSVLITTLDENNPPRGDAFTFNWQIESRAFAVPSATRTTVRLRRRIRIVTPRG